MKNSELGIDKITSFQIARIHEIIIRKKYNSGLSHIKLIKRTPNEFYDDLINYLIAFSPLSRVAILIASSTFVTNINPSPCSPVLAFSVIVLSTKST